MKTSLSAEPAGTRASQALTIIAQNIDQAAEGEGAICQDTGMPTFEVQVPVGADQIWMRKQIREAVAEATRRGKLRPNSVDSITGQNSGDNLGPELLGSLYEYFDHAGATPARAHQTIRAVGLDAQQAELLESEPGAPALLVARIVFDTHGRRIESSTGVYRGDSYDFQINVKRRS